MQTLKEKIREQIEKSLFLKQEVKNRLLMDFEKFDFDRLFKIKEILEEGENRVAQLVEFLPKEKREELTSAVISFLKKFEREELREIEKMADKRD